MAMEMTDIKKHKRIQQSILASAESAALGWLARSMPAWVNSDHLTMIGIAGMFLAGLFYYFSQWNPVLLHVVSLFIVANWFGDSLDGTLARYRNKLRPRYGFYVDHMTDNFGVLFLVTGLAFSGFMSPWVAVAVLVSYLLININIYLTTSTTGVFQISYGKLGPTELRVALIVGNLFLLYKPVVSVFGYQMLLFDVGGIVAAGVMTVILLATTAMNTRKLYCLERL
jgi:phosphatidylglycerophosphate synthase